MSAFIAPSRRPVTPGSMRRTTTFDLHLPGTHRTIVIRAYGRDTAVDGEGTVTELHRSELRAVVDSATNVTDIECVPAVPAMRAWRVPAMVGFRARAREAMPEAFARLPLVTLLEDVPVGVLITGYAEAKRDSANDNRGVNADPRPTDVCAGWRSNGAIVAGVARRGRLVAPIGHAVEVTPHAADAWHADREPPIGGIRRRRLLEVIPGDEVVSVKATLLDTYVENAACELGIHEYEVSASVDARTWQVREVSVGSGSLPSPDCYAAAPSARTAEGFELGALRASLGRHLQGPSTCTHLTDVLRYLDDARALVAPTEKEDA